MAYTKLYLNTCRTISLIGINLGFLSGTVYVTDNFKKLQIPFLISSIIIDSIMCGVIPSFKNRFKLDLVSFLYYIFVLFVFFSGLYNKEGAIYISSLGLLLIWINFTVYLPCLSEKYKIGNDTVLISILVCLFLFFLFSFATVPINIDRYEGVFSNPNAFGGVSVAFGILPISILLYLSNASSYLKITLYFFLVCFAFFCVLISNSRNAVLVFSSMFLFFLMFFFRSYIKKSHGAVILFFLFLLLTITVLYLYTDSSDLFLKIFDKFDKKASDPLDKRTEKWDYVFARLCFWGNGEELSFGAHSTYFSMLDQYGYVPFIALSLFVFVGTLKSFLLILKRSNNPMIYFSFLSLYSFGVIGFFEGMMLKTSMLLAIFGCSFIAKEPLVGESIKINSNNS